MTITVTQRTPTHPDALAMIAGSEEEQAALYPPEVRFAFSPQELIDADARFFVAYRDDEAVGSGGYTLEDGYAELKRMFVRADARSAGIADTVLQKLEQAVLEEGMKQMFLETGEDSPAAIGFYRRNGYVRRDPFGDYQENGSSVFMEKQLS